jgi:hypothetical protein
MSRSKKKIPYFLLVALLPFFSRMLLISDKITPVTINCWYGKEQIFGQIALTQRWVNVLGNISPAERIKETYYQINGLLTPFNLGPDLHRLARSGDFNLDIPLTQLSEGENHLIITAISSDGDTIHEEIVLIVFKNRSWPLPFEVDFSQIERIQETVQVVDGLWKLTKDGIRTTEPYYDRVLSIGDTSWTNYEITIKATVHDWTPSQPGPPTYNVSHFGVAMHWRGHHIDDLQPHRKWFPLGAQGEFLLKEATDSCRWRILFDGRTETKAPNYAAGVNHLRKELPVWFKAQVINLENGSTQYQYRQWIDGITEPENWDVWGVEDHDYPSGSLCLVPHNSDVTIHKIRIVPVKK